MKDYNIAKRICKDHGVKGFRKMKLKRTIYVAGKQTFRIEDTSVAISLIDQLTAAGFTIGGEDTSRSLAAKGMLDCLSIS